MQRGEPPGRAHDARFERRPVVRHEAGEPFARGRAEEEQLPVLEVRDRLGHPDGPFAEARAMEAAVDLVCAPPFRRGGIELREDAERALEAVLGDGSPVLAQPMHVQRQARARRAGLGAAGDEWPDELPDLRLVEKPEFGRRLLHIGTVPRSGVRQISYVGWRERWQGREPTRVVRGVGA